MQIRSAFVSCAVVRMRDALSIASGRRTPLYVIDGLRSLTLTPQPNADEPKASTAGRLRHPTAVGG